MKRFRIGVWSVLVVIALVACKFVIATLGFEILSLNTLIGSAIGGATFIVGFLLSGLIADYKEAERIPGEFRATLENILEEVRLFAQAHPTFDESSARERILRVVTSFFTGVHVQSAHDLTPCLVAIDALSEIFTQMEQGGMPPNFLVRLKTEQGIARRIVLRVSHIQRTQFIPSAHILALSLIALVIALLLLVKTEGSPESVVVFAFLSYLFVYVGRLISVIEQPFQEGAESMDDVSLFLLHELEEKMKVR